MAGTVRYCTTDDGVRLAWSLDGDGPPLLELNGGGESFAGENPRAVEGYGPIRAGRRHLRFDFRGVGMSDRRPPTFSHERMVRDLEIVADAAGLDRFALWGGAFSVPWAIEYAARHPDRVERLVLTGGFIRAEDLMPKVAVQGLIAMIRANWELASQMFADFRSRQASPEFGVSMAAEIRRNIEPEPFAQFLECAYDTTDVSERLREVTAPTLVVHRIEDALMPFAAAQEMAARIPNARLLALPGGNMFFLGDDVGEIQRALIDFLDEGRARKAAAEAAPGGVRTVLFTDLVGHTEMMQRLGDERGRKVLREHELITRDLLRQHGGAEIKTMGDGFMASFTSVTKATDCAIALQRAFAAHADSMSEQLRVRVGLNAGEPIEEDGDLFGATVIMASRIAAKAGAGEILIPEPLRHLLTGKSYVYADRGEAILKGFEDAVRLYEVRWRE